MKTKGNSKSKRKPGRRRNREPWNLIFLVIALHSAQAVGGWALYRESKADMSAGFERLEERMSQSEAALRADMSLMEDGLRADMSSMEDGLRADMSAMEDGLRADMSSMEDRLRAEISSVEQVLRADISGLRTDVSGLTERVARLEVAAPGHPAEDPEIPQEP